MNAIEELENDLTQVKINHNETAQMLADMTKQLEVMKVEAERDAEWPKDGCEYFYWNNYSGSDSIEPSNWQKMKTDGMRLNVGNIHRTKEEAEAYRDWLTNPRTQARRRVEMCDGFTCANGPELNYSGGALSIIDMSDSAYTVSSLYFVTESQAQACIDLLGEDVIKLALGVEL